MRYNVLKSCATRVCCACGNLTACVAEWHLTLRTGSERYGRKNPLPYLISERSHVGNLHQIRKQGKGRSPKRKENRRLSFLFAPAAGRGTFPPSADGESLAEVQRKTPRPLGATPLPQFEHPAQPVQEQVPPRQAEPACGSSCAPVSRCRKRSRPLGANPLTQFVCPGQPVQESAWFNPR